MYGRPETIPSRTGTGELGVQPEFLFELGNGDRRLLRKWSPRCRRSTRRLRDCERCGESHAGGSRRRPSPATIECRVRRRKSGSPPTSTRRARRPVKSLAPPPVAPRNTWGRRPSWRAGLTALLDLAFRRSARSVAPAWRAARTLRGWALGPHAAIDSPWCHVVGWPRPAATGPAPGVKWPICAAPLAPGRPPAFTYARSAARYEDPLREAPRASACRSPMLRRAARRSHHRDGAVVSGRGGADLLPCRSIPDASGKGASTGIRRAPPEPGAGTPVRAAC